MRILCVVLLLACQWVYPQAALAWEKISAGLFERPVMRITPLPDPDGRLVAATSRAVYVSAPDAKKWKRIFEVGSRDGAIGALVVAEDDSRRVYVGVGGTLYRGEAGGKGWERVFAPNDEGIGDVLSIGLERGNRTRIWIGTEAGLLRSDDEGFEWRFETGVPREAVFQISQLPIGAEHGVDFRMVVCTSGGIYIKEAHAERWRPLARQNASLRVSLAELPEGADIQDVRIDRRTSVAQSGAPGDGRGWYAFLDGELWSTDPQTADIGRRIAGGLPTVSSEIMTIEGGLNGVLVPGRDGLYWIDAAQNGAGKPRRVFSGGRINDLTYVSQTDTLYAATDEGLYQLTHPEARLFFESRGMIAGDEWGSISDTFQNEPGIHELLRAAEAYADVQSSKILRWRKQVQFKAWLPEVSVKFDRGIDENVDIDRGGTGDPDRFISGPEESDMQWTLQASWDLSELVWNPDQTSIDNRSKLMTQLREDITSRLIHLFYARRTLQIEELLASSGDGDGMIRRRLLIEEYGAGIDALTGGHLRRQKGQWASPALE
ncbi:MAG: hypothetical protein HQL11_04205 [Candidatus Omnitrophica bacterium]|nr:hypothetical protein [Candidatus Omnitrophota bacterium]